MVGVCFEVHRAGSRCTLVPWRMGRTPIPKFYFLIDMDYGSCFDGVR